MTRRAVVVPGRGQLVALFVPDGASVGMLEPVARFYEMSQDGLFCDVDITAPVGGILHWRDPLDVPTYYMRDDSEGRRTIAWIEPEGAEKPIERRGVHIAPVEAPRKPVEPPTAAPREPIKLIAASVRLANDTLKVIDAMVKAAKADKEADEKVTMDRALVIRAAVRDFAEKPERDRVAAVERNKWLERRAGIGAASKRPQKARKK